METGAQAGHIGSVRGCTGAKGRKAQAIATDRDEITLTTARRPLNWARLAQMAELVDALVSGTSGESRGGSSPLLGTISTMRDGAHPSGSRSRCGNVVGAGVSPAIFVSKLQAISSRRLLDIRPNSGQIGTPGVMAGLVPAIHVFLVKPSEARRGCPRQGDKRGHDAATKVRGGRDARAPMPSHAVASFKNRPCPPAAHRRPCPDTT